MRLHLVATGTSRVRAWVALKPRVAFETIGVGITCFASAAEGCARLSHQGRVLPLRTSIDFHFSVLDGERGDYISSNTRSVAVAVHP